MEMKKVVSVRIVKLPTKFEVMKDRTLLSVLPKRWQNNRMVLAAVSTLCAISLTACTPKVVDKTSTPIPTLKPVPTKTPTLGKLAVAPLFKHGEGYTAVGGMGGSYIKPISEVEAKIIIIDEAGKLGLNLIDEETILENVSTPETYIYAGGEDNSQYKLREPDNFSLDLVSKEGSIAIEYVSDED